MKYEEIINELKKLGNEKRRNTYIKNGASENTFGVNQKDLRELSKKIKLRHEEIIELYRSDVTDAQFLACMLMDSKELSKKDIDEMIKEIKFVEVVDKFVKEVVRYHKEVDYFIEKWSKSSNDLIRRSGWYLIVYKVSDKKYSEKELNEILNIIELSLKEEKEKSKWAMNHALCEIGIKNKNYTNRCIEIGERLGVYKDMKVAKGCVSAYAPNWINAVVKK